MWYWPYYRSRNNIGCGGIIFIMLLVLWFTGLTNGSEIAKLIFFAMLVFVFLGFIYAFYDFNTTNIRNKNDDIKYSILHNPPGGIKTAYMENKAVQNDIARKNAKKDGPCKWYFENGSLKAVGTYKNGKLEGLFKSYFENGNMLYEAIFKEGQPYGPIKEYYESGKLKVEATYKNGKQIGPVKYYDKNGKSSVKSDVHGVPNGRVES